MNVIVIMNDSFRRDHLGCYGNTAIHTPNLDRLAQESAVFDRAYIASYPTVPNRWDLNTGMFGFPYRGWQRMDDSDASLAQMVSARGLVSMLIHDTPMLAMDDMNYTRGYEAFRSIRGQHADRLTTDLKASQRLTAQAHKVFRLESLLHYHRNTASRRHEREHMVARSMLEAIDWLEENHDVDGFFLWVDSWDPHEPFDPPDHDWNRYKDPAYKGDKIIYPPYGRCNYFTDDEYEAMRALYAGKVTLVDRWVGRMLETVEHMGLMDSTLIVWTTDHGHLFGEHDLQGKPAGELGNLYEETTRIPLIIRHPKGVGAGKRVGGLAQPPDLVPTVLEFLDIPVPDEVQGRSLWPMVTGEKESVRTAAVSARFPQLSRAGTPGRLERDAAQAVFLFDGLAPSRGVDAVTVTTEEMAYVCAPAGRPSELYDLKVDPKQEHDLVDQRPEAAAELRKLALDFMREHGAPPGRIQPFEREGGAHVPLPLDTRLWGFRDEQGLWITFPEEEQARMVVTWDAPGPRRAVTETTLGSVLDDDPRSLVRVGQYYWAQDLI